MTALTANQALNRLLAGNQRFVARLKDEHQAVAMVPPRLPSAHSPMAIVLGCSDARVPAELVFDQGLGDLFVIRVAGNVVAPSQIGSVEFAAEQFGTPLVIVLGHSRCGAVRATLEALADPDSQRSRNLNAIVDRIGPAIAHVARDWHDDPPAGEASAVRANIAASVKQLRGGSTVIESRLESGELLIVGAHYELETGHVSLLDEAEPAA